MTAAEFWENVSPEPNTGCWIYSDHRSLSPRSYAPVRIGGVRQGAHRHALELATGAALTGLVRASPGVNLWALHRCDNKWCVNPDHLYAGTPQENQRDILTRSGRRPWGSNRAPSPLKP